MISRRRPRRAPIWCLVGALALPAAATAEPARAGPVAAGVAGAGGAAAGQLPEARRQFMLGERLFQAGRYAAAGRAYRRGYQLSGRPGFLINLAHCQVRLGQLREARDSYRQFLQQAPDGPRAADVLRAVHELDRQLGEPAAPPVELPAPAPAAPPPPPLPLTARDRPHRPGALDGALVERPLPPPPVETRREWLWPALGASAAALLVGSLALFAASRDGRRPLSQGSIGTIRR